MRRHAYPRTARVRKQRSALWLTFAEADDRYIDLVRVLMALSVLTILGIAISQEARGESVDLLALGTALAGILFGGGAAIGTRARLEDGSVAQQAEAGLDVGEELP